jgi:light-regulated signal transduction histidine kinase (bacteriophytochrome)
LVLRDAIPLFINNLVKALSPNEPENSTEETNVAKEHAKQRDEQGDYSLSQVIAEYFILQKTLLEVLEVELASPLSCADRDTILESIAIAVKEAGSKFAKLQMAHLQKSNEALEQFAHIASHDLQEPLRTIGSYLALIEKKWGNHLDSDLTDYFKFASDALQRMKLLIDSLLIYSQIGSAKEKMMRTDLNLAWDHALSNLESAIKDVKADVTSDHLPTLPVIPSEMERLFQNLISNSIKFRSDKPPVIHLSAILKDKHWLFSLSDNGLGIPFDQRESIFKLFSRLHSQFEIPGSGIGLSVCKRVVELHGGTIWVESNPAGGTIFKFSLLANLN